MIVWTVTAQSAKLLLRKVTQQQTLKGETAPGIKRKNLEAELNVGIPKDPQNSLYKIEGQVGASE